jgi:hypothetical protein
MDAVAIDTQYPISTPGAEAIAGANANGSPPSVQVRPDGDPALEALRQTQARRADQSRRRHLRMDRALEEIETREK